MGERWIAEPKPAADLIAIDLEPVERGDGGTVQLYRTGNGIVHARVVEPSGLVIWLQKVSG